MMLHLYRRHLQTSPHRDEEGPRWMKQACQRLGEVKGPCYHVLPPQLETLLPDGRRAAGLSSRIN
jgi:hypothetical protein